jgi:hypothetical protein
VLPRSHLGDVVLSRKLQRARAGVAVGMETNIDPHRCPASRRETEMRPVHPPSLYSSNEALGSAADGPLRSDAVWSSCGVVGGGARVYLRR